MAILVFIGAIVLAAGALLVIDRFMAGRAGRRSSRSGRDGEAGNSNAEYGFIEQQNHAMPDKGHL